MRTDGGRSVHGNVITNFLGWVDLLTHGAPLARARAPLLTHPRRPRGGQSGREKRRDKRFQAQAEKPLGTDSHRTISKRSRECWFLIGHKKCFVLLCPIGEQHLLSSFREFVHDGYWLNYGLSGSRSCTKEMHAIRNLSVWYKRYEIFQDKWILNSSSKRKVQVFPSNVIKIDWHASPFSKLGNRKFAKSVLMRCKAKLIEILLRPSHTHFWLSKT